MQITQRNLHRNNLPCHKPTWFHSLRDHTYYRICSSNTNSNQKQT